MGVSVHLKPAQPRWDLTPVGDNSHCFASALMQAYSEPRSPTQNPGPLPVPKLTEYTTLDVSVSLPVALPSTPGCLLCSLARYLTPSSTTSRSPSLQSISNLYTLSPSTLLQNFSPASSLHHLEQKSIYRHQHLSIAKNHRPHLCLVLAFVLAPRLLLYINISRLAPMSKNNTSHTMALTAQPAAHPNWGRWPQNISNDFNMMDGQGFLPYDTRGHPPAPAHQMQQQPQRQMAPQYVVGPAYNSHPAPPTFTTPQYQGPNAFQYVPYHSPSPTSPVGSPFRNEYQERQLPQVDQPRIIFQRDSKSLHEIQAPSPSTRSDSLASIKRSSISSHPTASAKTITYNETLNPVDRVNFDTDVDELMKAIQRKHSAAGLEASQGPTPAHTPRADHTEPSTPGSTAAAADNKPKKKWVCDGPNCNKSFVQKTHLDIHRRTHSGAKPYVCTKENCGLTFSQRGNLKTHMRRHTGEKPFSCRICGKTFAQRGNVRSHEETHKGMKPYVCKLDDCNKTFSQLGNMKTHQNNFHKESIKRLTSMFIKFAAEGDVPEEHQELFEYFHEHYKNSNKGVKGRGKARTVAARKPKGQPRSQSLSGPVPQQPLPHVPRHHSMSAYDLTSQTTAPGLASIPRTHNPEYTMFDQQDVLYEEEHGHHMSFTDRLY